MIAREETIMKILLELSYVGSAYSGFQVQENAPSVQKTLQEALEMFFDQKLLLTGCSRTDAGVHARQFYATIEGAIPESFPIERLPKATVRFLPKDIALLSARRVDDAFHVRYDVAYKEYEYLILNTDISDPFMIDRAYHYFRPIDAALLDRAAKVFVGRHDFAGFMSAGSKVSDTVRTVKYFNVVREGALVRMRIAADGFLYNMVRILCGTLLALSEGKIREEDLEEIIASKDRNRAGSTLPPEGLYLSKVVY